MKLKITFLTEEWSQSTKGGRSTFMRQMAIELSRLENEEVCILIPSASPEDKEDAQRHNIKVFEPEKYPGYEPVDCLLFPPEGFSTDVIIGYGIKPGCHGQVLKKKLGCKWIHVVLRNAGETALFQKAPVAISKGQEQHETEIKLCKNADMVLTVGSKLNETFNSALHQCKKDYIFNLIPGIFDEVSGEQKQYRNSKTFEILVFGRGNTEDFEHTGLYLAVKAVAQLNMYEPFYILKVVGAPEGEQEKLAERLEGLGISRNHLIVRSFNKERRKLAQLFLDVDLLLMPSGTGAFGLTALEALSAGVPILITHDSGLAEALEEVTFGHGCIVDQAAAWAKQIRRARKHKKTRLEEASMLRDMYKEKYCWQDQCTAFVKRLRALHSGHAEKMQQESKGKRRSPRKQVAGHAEEIHQEPQGKRSSPRKRVAGHAEEIQQESQDKRSSPRKRVAGCPEEMQQESQDKRSSPRKRVAGHSEEMQQESRGKRSLPQKRVAGRAEEMQQESHGKRSSPRKRVAGHAEEMQQESQGKRSSPRKRVAGHAEEMQQESQGKRSSPRKRVAGRPEEMQQESQGKRSSPRKQVAASGSNEVKQEEKSGSASKKPKVDPIEEPGTSGVSSTSKTRKFKEGVVTNDDLQTLGKAIGVKWDRLALRLPGVTEDDIEEIEDSRKTLSQRGFHTLKLWKTNSGEAADYKTLYYALVHELVQRRDLAEKYCL